MPRRSGFTIIEIMVALAVSGIVLLGARALLDATGDQVGRIAEAASRADREANAERTLRALVERIEVGTSTNATFAGDPTTASFSSWCEVPAGWLERCTVILRIVLESNGRALIARTSGGTLLRLRGGFRVGMIQYLDSPAAGGSWIRVWGVGITAPLALGIILDRDTLIVRIGERG